MSRGCLPPSVANLSRTIHQGASQRQRCMSVAPQEAQCPVACRSYSGHSGRSVYSCLFLGLTLRATARVQEVKSLPPYTQAQQVSTCNDTLTPFPQVLPPAACECPPAAVALDPVNTSAHVLARKCTSLLNSLKDFSQQNLRQATTLIGQQQHVLAGQTSPVPRVRS